MIHINELKVIAVLEVSEIKNNGDTHRFVTKSFDQSEPIESILAWAWRQKGEHGKLVITVDGMK
jgi:hypothetical protein